MLIRVDPKSSVPVFQQIVDEIKSAIARGVCAPDEMIPSVRHMAAQALVNPNTVAKAYRELEREGILYMKRGLGVFVSSGAKKVSRNGRRQDISQKLKEIAKEAERAGITATDLKKILDQTLRRK